MSRSGASSTRCGRPAQQRVFRGRQPDRQPAAGEAPARIPGRISEAHGYPLSFGTEVSINIAQDDELLQLFRDAGFGWVFIGIETTDPASLKETLKTQNMKQDMLASVRRIYSYGIDVLAGFIIGFDNDTLATFEQQ